MSVAIASANILPRALPRGRTTVTTPQQNQSHNNTALRNVSPFATCRADESLRSTASGDLWLESEELLSFHVVTPTLTEHHSSSLAAAHHQDHHYLDSAFNGSGSRHLRPNAGGHPPSSPPPQQNGTAATNTHHKLQQLSVMLDQCDQLLTAVIGSAPAPTALAESNVRRQPLPPDTKACPHSGIRGKLEIVAAAANRTLSPSPTAAMTSRTQPPHIESQINYPSDLKKGSCPPSSAPQALPQVLVVGDSIAVAAAAAAAPSMTRFLSGESSSVSSPSSYTSSSHSLHYIAPQMRGTTRNPSSQQHTNTTTPLLPKPTLPSLLVVMNSNEYSFGEKYCGDDGENGGETLPPTATVMNNAEQPNTVIHHLAPHPPHPPPPASRPSRNHSGQQPLPYSAPPMPQNAAAEAIASNPRKNGPLYSSFGTGSEHNLSIASQSIVPTEHNNHKHRQASSMLLDLQRAYNSDNGDDGDDEGGGSVVLSPTNATTAKDEFACKLSSRHRLQEIHDRLRKVQSLLTFELNRLLTPSSALHRPLHTNNNNNNNSGKNTRSNSFVTKSKSSSIVNRSRSGNGGSNHNHLYFTSPTTPAGESSSLAFPSAQRALPSSPVVVASGGELPMTTAGDDSMFHPAASAAAAGGTFGVGGFHPNGSVSSAFALVEQLTFTAPSSALPHWANGGAGGSMSPATADDFHAMHFASHFVVEEFLSSTTATTTANASGARVARRTPAFSHSNINNKSVVSMEVSVIHPNQEAQVTTTTLTKAKDDFSGNKTINQYLVLDRIGEGACGKVKLAYSLERNITVAIKIVRRAIHRAEVGVQSLGRRRSIKEDTMRREIDLMKRLRHPNLVSLFEVIDDPNAEKLYLVMRFADKGSVGAMREDLTCDAMPLRALVDMAFQVCCGLQYLHERGIYHRDIKPENILQTSDGQYMIGDFGISVARRRKRSSGGSSTALSSSNTMLADDRTIGVGTPLFMAPELRDDGNHNCFDDKMLLAAGDMWALGVSLMSLCCGRWPFPSAALLRDRPDVAAAAAQQFFLDVMMGQQAMSSRCSSNVCRDARHSWSVTVSQLLSTDLKDRPTPAMLRQACKKLLDSATALCEICSESKVNGGAWNGSKGDGEMLSEDEEDTTEDSCSFRRLDGLQETLGPKDCGLSQ